jgi:N-methylhydantoinase A
VTVGYRVGIDTGGTFTDLVLVDRNGYTELFKTPSTPDDPPRAIRSGLALIADGLGTTVEAFLPECELIIHGTTVALNALIQLQGAKVGLLCTSGHEDSLEIRNGHKEDGHRYDFRYPAATMLVPRHLRLPVTERVLSDGSVRTPLDEQSVLDAVEHLRQEKVDAVGVSFMWSFLHPDHERRVGEILAAELPDAYLTLSVDLLPQIREYTRTSTVAVNSYVGPMLQRYIRSIEDMLAQLGYRNPIRYVQSNGGLTSGRVFARKAVSALNSGPAAGPSASLHYAEALGRRDVLTLDVGGTSSDISLINDGRVDLVKDVDIGRYRVGIPLVNVVSIGAGGGSIGWIDGQGILHVGPQSAEAIPGPACYMRGGDEATVTDGLVVLGYLNQKALLGGRMPIDPELAERAIEERVAKPLRLPLERAALGIFNVVNANMIGGIRSVSVERGYDPRDFVLVAGGGATAAHAGRIAADLGISEVLIPKIASGLCAFGEALADVKHNYMTSYTTRFPDLDPRRLDDLFEELEARGRHDLAEEGFGADDVYVERSIDVKYADQVHECSVQIPVFEITAERLPEIEEAFHKRHEALYTYCERDNVPQLINVEVTVYGRSPFVDTQAETGEGARVASIPDRRDAYFEEYGEYRSTPVWSGPRLAVGDEVTGPAIIEEPTTTIVVFPGTSIALRRPDLYVMTVGPAPAGEAMLVAASVAER